MDLQNSPKFLLPKIFTVYYFRLRYTYISCIRGEYIRSYIAADLSRHREVTGFKQVNE